ncbi:hypothetical protein HKD27_05935 [Gluconobacter sp. R75690]|uniref:hypothetical protein n=1 Tax=unclassified Gluconobacter TaxID=2644261 RepID=UPI00188AEEF7|nr:MULTISPECIES: hypothetical protein [unclassified Gluconobacter]MBF0850465.1 hypothetical protein [Gluconobacter sp. R75690]MBF0879157.1 hypothetical protein [Gluconobacter sp. R75828]
MSNERIPILSEYRKKKSGLATEESTIEFGGGGGDNGGMDDLTRRVGALETKMDKVQEALVSIQVTLARMEEKAATKDELSNVRVEVAEMKGRVAKLPSLAQIAALLAIAGAIFKGLSFIHS